MELRKKLLLLVFSMIWVAISVAQEVVEGLDQDSVVQISVLKSDYSRLSKLDSTGQFLRGDVVFLHDSTYLYCDSAYLFQNTNSLRAYGNVTVLRSDTMKMFGDSLYYYGDSSVAIVYSDVVMESGSKKLSTDILTYDIRRDIMRYAGPSVLSSEEGKLYSYRGIYYRTVDLFRVADSVSFVSDSLNLQTDTLGYQVRSKMVLFESATDIQMAMGEVYCEDGYFSIPDRYASFEQNARFEGDSLLAKADRIEYFDKVDSIALSGDAQYESKDLRAQGDVIQYNRASGDGRVIGEGFVSTKDSEVAGDDLFFNTLTESFRSDTRSSYDGGDFVLDADRMFYQESISSVGFAFGEVRYHDTVQGITILTDTLFFDPDQKYAKAFGPARSLMQLEMEPGDSLYISADTLLSYQDQDSFQHFDAFYDVRIWSSQFTGLCDSLSYQDQDSLFRFWKLSADQPVVWMDTTQLTGDSIAVRMKDNKADKIEIRQSCLIVTRLTDPYYQQIKGKTIDGFFLDNSLEEVLVRGNAESIYYIQDEDGTFMGLNRSISGSIQVELDSNAISKIVFLKKPTLKYWPMSQYLHTTDRLEGFRWRAGESPQSVIDLRNPTIVYREEE